MENSLNNLRKMLVSAKRRELQFETTTKHTLG